MTDADIERYFQALSLQLEVVQLVANNDKVDLYVTKVRELLNQPWVMGLLKSLLKSVTKEEAFKVMNMVVTELQKDAK